MQRDLVERRGWFTKEEYVKSLALSQLAPGPMAAQLAICLGGAIALVVAWRFKIPEPMLIAAGAAAGLVIFALR